MKKLTTILFILISFMLVTQLSAQKKYAKSGVVELGGSISYNGFTMVQNGETAEESQSVFSIMPYLGYFVGDGFELGFMPGVNIINLGDGVGTVTNLMLFLAPSYNFNMNSNVYPYIEGLVGYSSLSLSLDSDPTGQVGSGDLDAGGLSYGGRAGVKIGIGKTGLLQLGVSYTMLNFTPKEDADRGIPEQDKRTGLNWLAITAGFTVYIE